MSKRFVNLPSIFVFICAMQLPTQNGGYRRIWLVERSKQSMNDFDKTGGENWHVFFSQQERENKKNTKSWKNYYEIWVNFNISLKVLTQDISMWKNKKVRVHLRYKNVFNGYFTQIYCRQRSRFKKMHIKRFRTCSSWRTAVKYV